MSKLKSAISKIGNFLEGILNAFIEFQGVRMSRFYLIDIYEADTSNPAYGYQDKECTKEWPLITYASCKAGVFLKDGKYKLVQKGDEGKILNSTIVAIPYVTNGANNSNETT